MHDHVEALAGLRRDEMAREQIVLRFVYHERVLAACVSFAKPSLADRVRNIKEMKLVGRIGLSDQ